MTTPPKKRPGRWKPGESGNPAGRTPGSGEVAKVRAAIATRIPELLEAMMQRALDGDVGAARLLLERTVAPLKATDMAQPLNLPNGTLTEQGRARLEELNRVIENYQHRVTCTIPEAELAAFSSTLNQLACNLRTIREEDNQH